MLQLDRMIEKLTLEQLGIIPPTGASTSGLNVYALWELLLSTLFPPSDYHDFNGW